jgi:Bacterial SH3 domain
MKKLLFCLFMATASYLNAQYQGENWQKDEGTLEGFTVDSIYFTLVSDANVREKPNTQATVLTKLPIGTAVKIVSISNDSFSLRGVKMPWLEVSFKENGAAKRGFVWGGFMATAAVQTPDEEGYDNRGVLYLVGIAAYEEKNYRLTAQVRVAHKGKELAKTEFVTAGDLGYYPSLEMRNEGFDNVKAALMVNFQYPACGYPTGDNLVFWTKNNQLTKMLEVNSVSEGGVFYATENYVLPSDKGGIGGHVLIVSDSAQMKESGTDYKVEKQEVKLTLHKWNGTKLVKLKEISNK